MFFSFDGLWSSVRLDYFIMNLIIESNELAFILEHNKHIFSIIEYLLRVLTQLKEIKF